MNQLFKKAQDKHIKEIQRRKWRDEHIALCLDKNSRPERRPVQVYSSIAEAISQELRSKHD